MSKLKKYLSKSEITSLNNLQTSLKENIVNVICVGLYNHGKSSLLNVLIKDFNFQTFKVSDARETTSSKKVVGQGVQYVDTPGLNAKVEDDQKVMAEIQTSDITLFVHNITTGELNKKEVEFLKQIKANWNDAKEFIASTLFVFTRTDKVCNHQDIVNAEKKVREQIQSIFQCDATLISVSSKDYADGQREDEEELIVESNITILEKEINALAKESTSRIKKLKKERFENKYWALHQKLNLHIESNAHKIVKLKEEQQKHHAELQQSIQHIGQTLGIMYAKLS